MDMDQVSQRLFQQTMDLWVLPEIDKRRREKRLLDNFKLKQAQIIFSLDKGRLIMIKLCWNSISFFIHSKPSEKIDRLFSCSLKGPYF